MSSWDFDDVDVSIDSWSPFERVWDDIAGESDDHIISQPYTSGLNLVSDWRLASKRLQRSNVRFVKHGAGGAFGLGGLASPGVAHLFQRGSSVGGGVFTGLLDTNGQQLNGAHPADGFCDDTDKQGEVAFGGGGPVGGIGPQELIASSTRPSWDDLSAFQLEAVSSQPPIGIGIGIGGMAVMADAGRAADSRSFAPDEEDVRMYMRDDISEGEDANASRFGLDGPIMSDDAGGFGRESDSEEGVLLEYGWGCLNELNGMENNTHWQGFSLGGCGGLTGTSLWLQSPAVEDVRGGLSPGKVCGASEMQGKPLAACKDGFRDVGVGTSGAHGHEGAVSGGKDGKPAASMGRTMYGLMDGRDRWMHSDEGLELKDEPGTGIVLNEEPETRRGRQKGCVSSGPCSKANASAGRPCQDQSTMEVAVGDDSEVVVNGIESPAQRVRRTTSTRNKAHRPALHKVNVRSTGTMTVPTIDSTPVSNPSAPSHSSRPCILNSGTVSSGCTQFVQAVTSTGNLILSDMPYIPEQGLHSRRLIESYPPNAGISPLQSTVSATRVPLPVPVVAHKDGPQLHHEPLTMEDPQQKRQQQIMLNFGIGDMIGKASFQHAPPQSQSQARVVSGLTAVGGQMPSSPILTTVSGGIQLQGSRQQVLAPMPIPHFGPAASVRPPVAVPTTHTQRMRYLQLRRLAQMQMNPQIDDRHAMFQPQQNSLQNPQDRRGQEDTAPGKYANDLRKDPSYFQSSGGEAAEGVEVEGAAPLSGLDASESGRENLRADEKRADCKSLNIPAEDTSIEAGVLWQLESTMQKLDINTRKVISDALYRLAESATQRAGGVATVRTGDVSGNTNNNAEESGSLGGAWCRDSSEKSSSSLGGGSSASGSAVLRRNVSAQSTSLDTNLIDRKIAKLLFHGPATMPTVPQGAQMMGPSTSMMQTAATTPSSALASNLACAVPTKPSSSLAGPYYLLPPPALDLHQQQPTFCPPSSIGRVMSAPQPWMWQQPAVITDAWVPASAFVGDASAVGIGLSHHLSAPSAASSPPMARFALDSRPYESPGILTGPSRSILSKDMGRITTMGDISGSRRMIGGVSNPALPAGSSGAAGIRTGSALTGIGGVVGAQRMGMGFAHATAGAGRAADIDGANEHPGMGEVGMKSGAGFGRGGLATLSTASVALLGRGRRNEGVTASAIDHPQRILLIDDEPGNRGFLPGEEGQEVGDEVDVVHCGDNNNLDTFETNNNREWRTSDGGSCHRRSSSRVSASEEAVMEAEEELAELDDGGTDWQWDWQGRSTIGMGVIHEERGGFSSDGNLRTAGEEERGRQGVPSRRQEEKMQLYGRQAPSQAQPPQKQRRMEIVRVDKSKSGGGRCGFGGGEGGCEQRGNGREGGCHWSVIQQSDRNSTRNPTR